MLVAIARAYVRQRPGSNNKVLEALASRRQSDEPIPAIVKAAAEAGKGTASFSSQSFAAATSSAIAVSSVFSSPPFSRGFASKSHKNKKKGRGGHNKRGESDSDDDGDSAPPSGKSGAAAAAATAAFDLEATRAKMSSSVDRLKKALSGLHAGRASPSMLEHVPVTVTTHHDEEGSGNASSSHVPLQALAAVTARDANTLVITPFDPSPATAASIAAALKLPPLKLENVRHERSGELVVPVPRATPDAVAALAKVARAEAEAARVAVRSVRKEANRAIGGGDGGEDARRRSEKSVQAAADEFVKKIDAALASKEADLAAV